MFREIGIRKECSSYATISGQFMINVINMIIK